MTAHARVTQALHDHGCTVRGRTAQCPAHDDRAPSLSLSPRNDRAGVVLHCHAGCATEDVVAALGLTMPDLFDEPPPARPQVVAEYPYADENGEVLLTVKRIEPGPHGQRKTFRQYRPDGRPGVKGIRRVLYRLPDVLTTAAAGGTIYICEGEKDADTLTTRAGVTATCNIGGAGKWRDDYTTALRGSGEVIVIADRDEPGRKHARHVEESIRRAGIPVRVLEPAAGKDATDHLAAGHTLDELKPPTEATSSPAPAEPPAEDLWAGELAAEPAAARQTPEQAAEEHFAQRLAAMEAELLDTDALDHIAPLQPLIKDLLFRNTLARIYGASGTFKSFMTLDIAGCVGTGTDWHGQPVTQGQVIYLVAEGASGIRKRVRAWEQHHGLRMDNVRFLPRPVQADSPEWGVLTALCAKRRPALIIGDTQARLTVGVEENSNTEMGRIVDRLEKLREASGACILLVHHAGHDSDRSRGATAVKGALQTELGIERKGKGLHDSQVTLKTGKQKDDEELADITFVLHQVQLDGEAKDDGSPVTSIVLVPISDIGQPHARTGHQARVQELAAVLDGEGVPSQYGRDRLRAECSRLGIKAENSLLSDVAKHRRNRTQAPNHLSGNLSAAAPGTGQEQTDNSPDRPGRTGANETPGQTCPGQEPDSSRQGSTDDLSAPLPSFRERTGRTADRHCASCGDHMTPTEPDQTTHPGCPPTTTRRTA